MLRIPFGSAGSVKETLSSLTEEGKQYFRRGFDLLSKAPKGDWNNLLSIAIQSFHGGYSKDWEKVAASLRLGEDDARTLLAALGMIAAIISTQETSANEFVDVAIAEGVIDEAWKAPMRELVESTISMRQEVKRTTHLARLSQEVLPSLDAFEIAVDARLSFQRDGGVELGVPVAVVHIDTDSYEQEIWFQMTKEQVAQALDELKEVHRRLQAAEGWLANTKG